MVYTCVIFTAIAFSLSVVPTLAAPVVRDSNMLGAQANVNTVLFARGICASRPACSSDSPPPAVRPPAVSPPVVPPPAAKQIDSIDPSALTPFYQTVRDQVLAEKDPRTLPGARAQALASPYRIRRPPPSWYKG